MPELTNTQREVFCVEYLVDFDASAAALRAGYAHGQHGRRMMQDQIVRDRIAELRDEQTLRTQITADRIALEYARLAFSDIRDTAQITVFEPEGDEPPEMYVRFKTFAELPRDVTAAIKEIGERVDAKGRTVSLKLHDKQRALDVLRDRYWVDDATNDGLITGIEEMREGGDVPDLSEEPHATHNTYDANLPAEGPGDESGADVEPDTKWRR